MCVQEIYIQRVAVREPDVEKKHSSFLRMCVLVYTLESKNCKVMQKCCTCNIVEVAGRSSGSASDEE